ncbi:MAG: hypothetical protein GY772_24605, partial [bacterium]|nr:hypothetical protein [bacterium]
MAAMESLEAELVQLSRRQGELRAELDIVGVQIKALKSELTRLRRERIRSRTPPLKKEESSSSSSSSDSDGEGGADKDTARPVGVRSESTGAGSGDGGGADGLLEGAIVEESATVKEESGVPGATDDPGSAGVTLPAAAFEAAPKGASRRAYRGRPAPPAGTSGPAGHGTV